MICVTAIEDRPTTGSSDEGELLAGRGLPLGALVRRFPPENRTLLHVLRSQANAQPDKAWIIVDGTDRITFGQAYARSLRFADALANAGLTRAHVALFLRNHVRFMEVFYGSMLQRGVAVPLNPELRGSLLEATIVKSDARVIVVGSATIERLQQLEGLGKVELVLAADPTEIDEIASVPVVDFETWVTQQASAGNSDVAAADLPAPEDTAAILFTSGTTGGSKGVVCSHKYLYLFSGCFADSTGLTPDDVVTTPLQLCHVAALGAISNAALHVGSTAHLKSRFSASAFWEQVAADGATFCMLIGQMAEMILKSTDNVPEHSLSHLYLIPRPPHYREFEERFGTELIWQGSGLTEAFPHPPRKERIEDVPGTTVGHPLAWYDYGVVDENDRLLPPYVEGELVYRSRIPFGMFSGYYKDPQATAHAMRNAMFHTGDLAFYDDAGHINYLRRMADTIRRSGENVSCTELEDVALLHEDILEAAAYGVPDQYLGEDIKVDIVARVPLDLHAVHAWMAVHLPRYMVPGFLEQREGLPKTPSEKVMKHVLKEGGVDRPGVVRFANERLRGSQSD